MHSCPAALPLAPRRIGQTDFPKSASPRFNVAGFRIGQQLSLKPEKRFLQAECLQAARKDARLDERQQLAGLQQPTLHCSMLPRRVADGEAATRSEPVGAVESRGVTEKEILEAVYEDGVFKPSACRSASVNTGASGSW